MNQDFYTEAELELLREQLKDGIEKATKAVEARGVRKLHPRLKQIQDCDIGSTISEETKQALKEIDKNTQYAIMNAHKMWCD